jgi:peptidoglycan hydrolase-like protein with peptidoglycan-binding domain
MMRTTVFGVLALSLLLAGCGSDTSQRAATGGLTGAGAGALIGGPIGAVAGAAIGAGGGTAMPEGADTVAKNALNQERNSGRTALNNAGLGPSSRSSTPQAQQSSATTVKDAQRELQREGLYHGKIDGIAGPQTRQAVAAFQKRVGLKQTAQLDHATLDRLASAKGTAQSGTAASHAALRPSELRQRLGAAGYSNITDLRRVSDTSWSANAQRGGQSVALRVDAQSGRVTKEQNLASTAQPSSGSSTAPGAAQNNPPAGSASTPSPGGAPSTTGH